MGGGERVKCELDRKGLEKKGCGLERRGERWSEVFFYRKTYNIDYQYLPDYLFIVKFLRNLEGSEKAVFVFVLFCFFN